MITKKELITFLRLLDLYKICKDHKQFLNYYKTNDVTAWYEIWNKLIDRCSQRAIEKSTKASKLFLKKTNKQQYIKAYK